jgi:hypothetical protein
MSTQFRNQAPHPYLTLASGTKLGRYEIRSKAGAGGMGQVYRDLELDRRIFKR